MKNLSTYIECCDGAATPSTVMGIGNPMAPDGEIPGSGDTFDYQKTAKAKRRKKDLKTTDKKHQEEIVQPATEGLLDADFGMDDSFDEAILDDMVDKYAAFVNHDTTPTKAQYMQFYERFRALAKSVSRQFEGVSLMRAFRSKDYTIISFKEKSNGLNIRSRLDYEYGIEIRKFVQNPLPWAIEIAWSKWDDLHAHTTQRVNHPTSMNIKFWDAYIAPADLWDKLQSKLKGYYKLS